MIPTGLDSTQAGSVSLVEVSKTYSGATKPAVNGVSLEIEKGSFFSILGPSGSGKTTILRMIAGFEYPTHGRVKIGGVDVTDRPPNKRPLHTVFQNYALFPHLNVFKNVAYPLRMHGASRQEIQAAVTEVLERVSLIEFETRKPDQLSGGQRQRVALARALVNKPKVVLLDEPLGALDLRLRQDMQIVLKHIQRDFGTTFIYVTHDQGEALGMSDRIAIMANGVVHQVGTPSQIYFRPETPFVASFVGKSNLIPADYEGVGTADASSRKASTFGIRPESIRVGAAAEGCDRRLSGTVDEVLFQGAFVEITLTTSFARLVAHVAANHEYRVGESVAIGWNFVDAIAIEDVTDGAYVGEERVR